MHRSFWSSSAAFSILMVLSVFLGACSDGITDVSTIAPGGRSDTDFQLETLEVTACQYGGEYPNCKSAPIEGSTTSSSTGTSAGSTSGGGGTTTTQSSPSEGLVADDETITCDGLPGCDMRPPTAAELQTVLNEIGKIRTDGFCGQVRESALQMVQRGLQVWTKLFYIKGDDGRDRKFLGETRWVYDTNPGPVMHLWNGALDAWTIAHEAIHGIPYGATGYRHADITPLNMNLDDTAKYCSGH